MPPRACASSCSSCPTPRSTGRGSPSSSRRQPRVDGDRTGSRGARRFPRFRRSRRAENGRDPPLGRDVRTEARSREPVGCRFHRLRPSLRVASGRGSRGRGVHSRLRGRPARPRPGLDRAGPERRSAASRSPDAPRSRAASLPPARSRRPGCRCRPWSRVESATEAEPIAVPPSLEERRFRLVRRSTPAPRETDLEVSAALPDEAFRPSTGFVPLSGRGRCDRILGRTSSVPRGGAAASPEVEARPKRRLMPQAKPPPKLRAKPRSKPLSKPPPKPSPPTRSSPRSLRLTSSASTASTTRRSTTFGES